MAPPPALSPGKSHGLRSLMAVVHGVAESRTQLSDFTFTFHFHALEKENGNPLQCSCLENPRDGGAWWAAIYGAAQSRTRLKRLSSIHNMKISTAIFKYTYSLVILSTFILLCSYHHLSPELCTIYALNRLPKWLRGKESACQCRSCRRHGFSPCVRKSSSRRKWQPTPVFLPGKTHRQRSLVGNSTWAQKESDTT